MSCSTLELNDYKIESMTTWLSLLALCPFLVFMVLLLSKKASLLNTAIITLCLVTLAMIFGWQILPNYLLYSFIKGFWVAFDIFIIIFGAIFFLEVLEKEKIIDNLISLLEGLSKDYRVKIIILAWFLESFLEGTTGFGAPLVIVAPLLVGLGLSPMTAVVICLLGNSTSNLFGAVGAPIRIGFAGLNTSLIPRHAASLNLVGLIVPTFMLWVLSGQHQDRQKYFWEALPFALWSGFAFVVPSLLITNLGQEFPSILGAAVGLSLVILTIRLKIFVPKKIRTLKEEQRLIATLPIGKVVFPYLLLISFLILGKIWLGAKGIDFLIGGEIKHRFSCFNPGFAFILAGALVVYLEKKQKQIIFQSLSTALKRTLEPFSVIVCLSAVVQLMTYSNYNYSGLPSVLNLLAKNFETPLLPFWSPFIGAFGSFLTGSITISNLMFGNFLNLASNAIKLDANKILALEAVGAAAGNMLALADMLVVETIVGLKHQEREILKAVVLPCLIYILLVGLLGILTGKF